MTDKQRRKLYFPAWSMACHVNGWRMERGRLAVDESKMNRHAREVWSTAAKLAAAAQRACTLDDLRHAAHIVVLGTNKSSSNFNNREVDKVVSFFKLLQDDTDLGAAMHLNNPDLGSREALVKWIIKANIPFAVINGVCKKSFAPVYTEPYYEDLPLANLSALVGILKEIQEREQLNREL